MASNTLILGAARARHNGPIYEFCPDFVRDVVDGLALCEGAIGFNERARVIRNIAF